MLYFDSTIVFCFIPLLLAFYFYFSEYVNYWRKRGVKGPTPLPFIGNSYSVLFKASNLVEEERLTKYGRIYGTMEGSTPVITIGEPELIKTITIKDFQTFKNRAPIVPHDPVLSLILDDLNDDHWKRVRNIVSPAFSSSKLKRMCPLVEKSTVNAIEYLKLVCEQQDIHLKKFSFAYTVDVMARCVIGVDMNCFDDVESEFLRNAADLVEFDLSKVLLTTLLPEKILKLFRIQLFPENLIHYFLKMMKHIVEQRRTMNTKHFDLVALLLEAELNNDTNDQITNGDEKMRGLNKKLTENEIIAQLFHFLTTGYETLANLLSFFFYSMAIENETQEKLFVEIQNYFEKNKGELNYDELMLLPYLDAVLNETMRMYTPSISFNRICDKDYVLGNTGVTIPKGTVVNLPFYAMHHDPRLFPSPHQFKPERFLPENKDQIQPYSFLPFGVGPRNCVGLKLAMLSAKVFVAKVLNEFKIEKSPKTPTKPIYTSTFVVLLSKPLHVKFVRRSNTA